MSKNLPMPVVCECGFNTMDAGEAIEHLRKRHPEASPNCRDIGNGVPCGNYPARTGDDCTFCTGWPR